MVNRSESIRNMGLLKGLETCVIMVHRSFEFISEQLLSILQPSVTKPSYHYHLCQMHSLSALRVNAVVFHMNLNSVPSLNKTNFEKIKFAVFYGGDNILTLNYHLCDSYRNIQAGPLLTSQSSS